MILMVNKKRSLIYITLLSFIMLLPYVSAQLFFTSPAQFMSDAIRGITDVFRPVLFALFGEFGGEDFLFAKMLLGILLFVVINVVVKKIPMFRDNKSVSIIVALVISLLAIRFINENELVNGILLPYGVLGVAITTLLPFFIFFFFIHESNWGNFGRKIGWVFFGIIFLVLWVSKYNAAPSDGGLSPVSNQIYSWVLIAIIIAFIFDKFIHGLFGKHELNKFKQTISDKQVADAHADIAKYSPFTQHSREARHLVDNAFRVIKQHKAGH